ncbi:DUF3953 domain-containing protein [Paenibacillus sp. T2-29]
MLSYILQSLFFTIGLEERQKKNSAMSLITSLS